MSVVTVNYSNGFIMATGAGTADIYATAKDGSGISGVCEITVYPTIRVQAVEIFTEIPETMYVGDTMTLQAAVCPMNATNQTITWSSSNEDVAEVGMYTGELVIKSVGTATITATSADGQYTDSHTIKAWIDTVIIEQDGIYTKVIFQSSNKVWYGVHNDMIFNETNITLDVLVDRACRNFFHNYDETTSVNMQDFTPSNIRQFTNDELRLLYAIDPYGVAHYISSYSKIISTNSGTAPFNNFADELEYKDYMFSVIYGRQPNYFKHTSDGSWVLESKDSPEAELSESEALFGGRPAFNELTWQDFATIAIDIICTVFNVPGLQLILDQAVSLTCFVISSVKVLTTGEGSVKEEFASFVIDGTLSYFIDKSKLEWISPVVSLFLDTLELIEWVIVDTSNFYGQMMNYCAYESDYLVYAKLKNGQLCKLDDICEAVSNYNNNN